MSLSRQLEMALEKKRFLENPDSAGLGIDDAARIHGVSRSSVIKWRKEAGFASARKSISNAITALMSDPDFGREGETQPCSSRNLAIKYGVSESTVSKHRRMAGVLSPHGGTSGWINRKPPYSKRQRMGFAWLASWPRPEGMDEHLESL